MDERRPKTVDEHLNEVDYTWLSSGGYVPSLFSLKFINFVKAVNGEEGEENETPPMHLSMLDNLANRHKKIVNLCFRGSGKTSIVEYLILYLAMFGEIPGFGPVTGMIYVSDSMDNGVRSMRMSVESRYEGSDYLKKWIPNKKIQMIREEDGIVDKKGVKIIKDYMEFRKRDGSKLGVNMYGAQSGIRGVKIFNKRPVLAIMDDLTSDADANSPSARATIHNTIHSGLKNALLYQRHKMVLNGTPFNKEDIIYKAIESGAWLTNVWPICEKFPCTREEFRGAWEDRFDYDSIMEDWESNVKQGTQASFRQELMLRITSDESRLVKDEEIKWVSRAPMLSNKENYNFYITTDFGISSKQTADNTVLSTWAYDTDKRYTWTDGECKKQTMDITMDNLFDYVVEYKPKGVAIEISGQQGGYVPWIQNEMRFRGIWFTLTIHKGQIGVRPVLDKLARFQLVVPMFKAGRIRFPLEMKGIGPVAQFIDEISLATEDGIKGKDDCLDSASQIPLLNPVRPIPGMHVDTVTIEKKSKFWGDRNFFKPPEEETEIDSYLV